MGRKWKGFVGIWIHMRTGGGRFEGVGFTEAWSISFFVTIFRRG